MKDRCYNVRHPRFADYGGKGITVDAAWLNCFCAFLADVGKRPVGMTLDRLRNDLPYRPGNVRWATPKQQARNRSNTIKVTINGIEMLFIEACERFDVKYTTARRRLEKGASYEQAFGAAP